MFEPFSSGYYLGRLYVGSRDDERAVLDAATHRYIRQTLYEAAADVTPVLKLDRAHFPVDADDSLPDATLEAPAALLDDTTGDWRRVLVAKVDRASQLERFCAQRDADTDEGDGRPPSSDALFAPDALFQ